jgi:hypothetical protein
MIKQPNAAQVARTERMRIAAREGAETRALVVTQDAAIRKNMERLKALRLAKEAENAALPPAEPAPKKRSPRKKVLAET